LSIRLTDPAGESWIVKRQWFGLPRWSRRRIDIDDAIDPAQAIPYLAVADSLAGLLVLSGLLILLGVVVVLAIAFAFFVLLVFLLAGVVVALALLTARFLSFATWLVEARTAGTLLVWRVRGTARAARAVREVAAALRRGDEPLVEGQRPDIIEPSRV